MFTSIILVPDISQFPIIALEKLSAERSSNIPHLVTYPLNFTECYYLLSECPIPTLFIYQLFLMFQSSPQHLISLKFSDLPAVHILP